MFIIYILSSSAVVLQALWFWVKTTVYDLNDMNTVPTLADMVVVGQTGLREDIVPCVW
jgi:hypothetical protein